MALSDEHTPEYDAKITKGGVTLGFRLCDGQGMHDPFSISQDQQSRSAVKIASGDTKHSDYEPPYATEETRDWSVGRGMNDGDEEEGRFFDSKSAWTAQKGRIMLGPQWQFATGLDTARHFQTNMFDKFSGDKAVYYGRNLGDQLTYWRYAVRIQADQSYSAKYVEFIVKYSADVTTSQSCKIYADNAGAISTLLGTGTITIIPEQNNYYVYRFTFATPVSLTSGTYYWLSFESSLSSTEYHTILTQLSSWAGSESVALWDGSWNYNPSGYKPPFYRIMEEGTPYDTYFTSYLGVPIAVVDWRNTTWNMYINGFVGWVEARTWDDTYLNITIANDTITANDFDGCQITFVEGKGSELKQRSVEISSNTSTVIKIAIADYPDYKRLGANGTMFVITGGSKWYKCFTTDKNGGVTDVKTVGDIIYIARGDYAAVGYVIYPSSHLQDYGLFHGAYATHIEYALDSNNTPRIWLAKTNSIEKSSYPLPQIKVDGSIIYGLDLNIGDLVTNGLFSFSDTGWSDVGTPDETIVQQEYAWTGPYSMKVVANADGQGVTQDITTTTGDQYEVKGSILIPPTIYITNGDMELDASWPDSGSPTTNERSLTQAHAGTYSRHLVGGDNTGCQQALTGFEVGQVYTFTAYAYVDAGSANGCTMTIDSTDLDAVASTGAWVKMWGSFTATATTHTIKFLSDGGDAEFYIDDVYCGPENGAKLMFAGVEIGAKNFGDYPAWSNFSSIVTATADTHTLQVLSDGGASVFYLDDLSVRELPTYIGARNDEHITNLIVYGEPERLWVLTNAGIYQEDGGALTRVPIYEMRNASDTRNGIACTVYDVYLMFSFLNGGIERYYKSNLDDIGPDRDEGLLYKDYSGTFTITKRGEVVDLQSYPTGVFAAVDAAKSDPDNGYPSILFFNNGWHEIWSGDVAGERITAMHIQPIDGDNVDKLWFTVGNDMMWIPIDKNPETNPNYRYTYESVVESPWITRGKHDVVKYLDEVTLVTRVNQYVTLDVDMYYMLDDDTDWTLIGNFDTIPRDAISVGSHDVEGRKIKFKLTIRHQFDNYTPRIEAVLLDLIENVPVKDSWSFQFLLNDDNVTLLGKPENTPVEDVVSAINTMRQTPAPVYLETRHSAYDGKWASVLTFSSRPIANNAQGQVEQMVGTLTLIEA